MKYKSSCFMIYINILTKRDKRQYFYIHIFIFYLPVSHGNIHTKQINLGTTSGNLCYKFPYLVIKYSNTKISIESENIMFSREKRRKLNTSFFINLPTYYISKTIEQQHCYHAITIVHHYYKSIRK